jgi:maleylacetoacetate isomerase
MLTLYSYFRSSSSYRVRIALALKNLDYETAPVHLVKGEQFAPEYMKLNPQGLVPCLIHDGAVIAQSMAIVEYLDDIAPEPKLVSGDPKQKAHIRRLAQLVACDIHPINNVRVLKYLQTDLGLPEEKKLQWYAHWAALGMTAFERILRDSPYTGGFCVGDNITMADLAVVSQLYNMRRYKVPLDDFPLCRRIEKNCVALPAFIKAAPETQPDAPKDLEPIHGPNARL